ncbi:putative ribonuclease H-like domain-containing protein [Tanacetum coccineum]
MLRAYAIDFGKGWVNHLPLVEFSYNNSYHASIKATPFEALYGRKCHSPVCWTEFGEAHILGSENLFKRPLRNHPDQAKGCKTLLTECDRHKSYADRKRKPMDNSIPIQEEISTPLHQDHNCRQVLHHEPEGNPQQDLKDKGVIDNGCFRHMTGNRSYLTYYEEIDGAFVTFGGSTKGGKITRKGKISTDTECVVLSPDFKLLDESHVLLKVPRKDNMYSVDLKNVVPQGGLTCLFAKATLDESNLWHMRLGHINFKTMNTLVRGNLVRGLPLKNFENDHTCVACQKGKQHKASCKTKTISSISQPLQMLHMDLFGPTFVKSIMKKMYCLVVTDDYKNLIDQKVKIIRCDNGTEFKNKEMNQFCEKQGIKRELSVSRTPQQNGVAKRKNRTLIKAARTMLADSKLPTTFWAEAVNTACYVQNRVLVIKPHNKTPYELFHGRTPSLSFMRPFRCHVTILNTLDHLGKFDGKVDEGFFVGYSVNSKAFRVFNSRTRIVEETFHVTFLENKPNVAGSRPSWFFDIDTLTKSMNYKPVVVGNQSNGSADLLFSSSSKDCPNAGFKPLGEEEKKDAKVPEKESGVSSKKDDQDDQDLRDEFERLIHQEKDENVNSTNNINNVSSTVNTASINDNVVDENIVYGCENDLNMPNLEEIVYLDDDEDVAEADVPVLLRNLISEVLELVYHRTNALAKPFPCSKSGELQKLMLVDLAIWVVVTPPEEYKCQNFKELHSEWDTHCCSLKVKKSAGASNDDKNLAFVLEEFKEPEVNEYCPRDSSLKPTTGCDKESNNSKENTNDSLEQHQMTDTETSSFESLLRTVRYADKSLVKEKESQVKSSFVKGCGSNTSKIVSEVESKKVRMNNNAPIIEDWVSDDEEQDESKTKPGKKTVILLLLK